MTIFELNKIANHNADQVEKILMGFKTSTLEDILMSDTANDQVLELAQEIVDRREFDGEIDAAIESAFSHDNNAVVSSLNEAYAV